MSLERLHVIVRVREAYLVLVLYQELPRALAQGEDGSINGDKGRQPVCRAIVSEDFIPKSIDLGRSSSPEQNTQAAAVRGGLLQSGKAVVNCPVEGRRRDWRGGAGFLAGPAGQSINARLIDSIVVLLESFGASAA